MGPGPGSGTGTTSSAPPSKGRAPSWTGPTPDGATGSPGRVLRVGVALPAPTVVPVDITFETPDTGPVDRRMEQRSRQRLTRAREHLVETLMRSDPAPGDDGLWDLVDQVDTLLAHPEPDPVDIDLTCAWLEAAASRRADRCPGALTGPAAQDTPRVS